jgi:hypothetical protein
VEPVLVQIDKCGITEKPYDFEEHNRLVDNTVYRDQLINFMIQGRLDEKLHFDIDEIEQGLDKIGLSARNEEFVEELIAEYRAKETLDLWKDDNFRCLSNRVSEILAVRPRVEKCVLSAADNQELSDELRKIVEQKVPGVSWEVILTLSQCFMKDMSVQKDEHELRQKIYNSWFDSVKEGRRIL